MHKLAFAVASLVTFGANTASAQRGNHMLVLDRGTQPVLVISGFRLDNDWCQRLGADFSSGKVPAFKPDGNVVQWCVPQAAVNVPGPTLEINLHRPKRRPLKHLTVRFVPSQDNHAAACEELGKAFLAGQVPNFNPWDVINRGERFVYNCPRTP